MKLVRNSLLLTMIAASLLASTDKRALAQSAPLPNTVLGGPLLDPVDLYTVLSMNKSISPAIWELFTTKEKLILQQISVYKDAVDNNSYYTVKPIRMRGSFAESKQYINFKSVERVFNALEQMGDLDFQSMKTLVKLAATISTEKDDTESRKIYKESFKGIQQDVKDSYLSIVRTEAAKLNATPTSIATFDDALRFTTILLNVPVAQLKFTAAPAYSDEQIVVIEKFRKNAPQINFYSLQTSAESPVYTLTTPVAGSPSAGIAPEDKDGTLQSQYDILSGMNNKLLSNSLQQNVEVAGVGTVLGFDLYYNLVAGFGDTPTEYGINDARFEFTGAFKRNQTINVSFEGKVKCKFNAKIKDGYVIEIDRQDKYVINDGSRRTETAEESIDMAACRLFRNDGEAISDDKGLINLSKIPDNIGQNPETARKLTTLLQQRIEEYKNTFSQKYYAAQSLKNEIINAAINKANGWKMLPLSIRQETRYKWGTRKECVKVPYEGSCTKSEKRWRWQGVKSGYYTTCTQHETLYDEQCKDIESWIGYIVDVPVPVRYTDKVVFEKNLSEETTYDLKFNDTNVATIYAPNEICMERIFVKAESGKAIFDRVDCTASGSRANQQSRYEDAPAVERPAAGDEGKDPFEGKLPGTVDFDPFA